MNLKQIIKKVLIQETENKSGYYFFLRRIEPETLEYEFEECLEDAWQSLIRKHDEIELDDLKRQTISRLMDTYHGPLSDWGESFFNYNDVFDGLLNKFSDKIEASYRHYQMIRRR